MAVRTVIAALGCLLAWAAVAAPAAEGPAATQPGPATRPAALAKSRPAGAVFGGGTYGNRSLTLKDDPGRGPGAMLRRMMAYTLVILVLGGVGLFVVRKVLPKLGATQGKKHIAVLETVYLGPKKSLHLLRVGAQRFLVAGSRDGIAMLGEVTSAFPDDDEPAATKGKRAGFSSILKGKDLAAPVTDKS